jgi:integrase
MVSGHLHEKKGYYYLILNVFEGGKRKPKWVATGIPAVKGNKKKAEALLIEERKRYTNPDPQEIVFNPYENMLFADYMKQWLEIVKSTIETVTYASYKDSVKIIERYFKGRNITLVGLKAQDIQEFYQEQLKRVKASTVIHYHANIHKALKHAVKMEIIPSNPADKVERPKKEKFTGAFYDGDEINRLFELAKGTRLEIPIMLGAFYGLRRSEIVGLKWNAIDFKNDSIAIKHTVTSCNIDGERVVVAKDSTKTKSSFRTLPLVPFFKERLIAVIEKQKENRRLCGRCYCKDYLDYICVDEMGERIKPDYITAMFPSFLEKNNMRRIRFHDLRHPYVKPTLKNFLLIFCEQASGYLNVA